jgi:hypothetical protein
MKLGTENKKSVYALTVLGVVAAYMVYSQFFSGPSYKPVTTAPVRPDIADGTAPAPEKSSGPDISRASEQVSKGSSRSKTAEFHPVLRPKQKEKRIVDLASVDPTIRFDLLDRAMKVPPAGGERDLFQISKAPPAKPELASVEPKVHPFIPYGPRTPPPPTPPPPPPPPPPPTPIPFKYYGVSSVHPDGTRTAYFIIPSADGDEILMANEGQVLKGRFRIVQISLDKVVVEDTQDKRRQPLNMEKENTG